MSSQGQAPGPDRPPELPDVSQGRFSLPVDLTLLSSGIDLRDSIELPLMATLTRQQLTFQLGLEYTAESSIVDVDGLTHRIGDVADPETIWPLDSQQLDQAQALQKVRYLAGLTFDESMKAVGAQVAGDQFETDESVDEDDIPPADARLRPDQADEFYEAYSEYSQMLGRYLSYAFKNVYHGVDEVEDIVQDTWARAVAKWNLFTPGTNRKAWLFRIGSNLLRSKHRKQQKKPPMRPVDPTEPLFEAMTADIDRLEGLHRGVHIPATRDELEGSAVDLAKRLMELGVATPFVPLLVGYYGLDMNYPKIATELDIAMGSVSSGISRGRKALREKVRSTAEARDTSSVSSFVVASQLFERTTV